MSNQDEVNATEEEKGEKINLLKIQEVRMMIYIILALLIFGIIAYILKQ